MNVQLSLLDFEKMSSKRIARTKEVCLSFPYTAL